LVMAPAPSDISTLSLHDALPILRAIADAELRPDEIEYVCAHGTATPANDSAETRVLKLALGEHAYRIPVSSVKSMIGHLLGAARSEEHTSELQSRSDLVCRLLLE